MKLLLCTALSAALPAGAQALQDPTRPPPASMLLPAEAARPVAVAREPVLQSVLVGPGSGREVAVIDGRIVRRGERVGRAILDDIRSDRVILREGHRMTELKLYPQAGKPPVKLPRE
ncbi:MAG TPA: MSHA biogenesis protein MshK [Pseudoduganella sp.]